MVRSTRKVLFDPLVFGPRMRDALQQDLEGSVPLSVYHLKASRLWVDKLLNKHCLPGDNLARRNAANTKFLTVNGEMAVLNQALPHLLRDQPHDVLSVIRKARNLIALVLGDSVPLPELFDSSRHSGGASVGVLRKDTSLEAKWTLPMSYAGNALSYFYSLLNDDFELRSAFLGLNGLPSTAELGPLNSNLVKRVKGSSSTTVPKDNSIDRFIAVEPTINMFLQQGLAEAMWKRMRKWGLSLERDQEKHRRLACFGSITNRLATIDFSSMSDRVSCAVVSLLFPREWYCAFMDLRCPFTNVNGEWVRCEMISSMGNATTFPLETLILWSLAVASSEPISYEKSHVVRRRDIGTFGDDVILPSRDVPIFLEVCKVLGFVINVDKSFYGDEYFRESCGGDFFHGRDVRPIYLKAFPTPTSRVSCEAHLYTTINRVIQKYIQYFGPLGYVYEKALLRFLCESLLKVTNKIKFVPSYFPEDSGICILHDVERFAREYVDPRNRSVVLADQHGCLRFHYLEWKTEEKSKDDHLRFATWLRSRAHKERDFDKVVRCRGFFELDEPPVIKRTTRENGKYVNVVSKLRTKCPPGYDRAAWQLTATSLDSVTGKVPG